MRKIDAFHDDVEGVKNSLGIPPSAEKVVGRVNKKVSQQKYSTVSNFFFSEFAAEKSI